MSWASEFEGWYSRARPHPSPSEFIPTRDRLSFAVLHSAQADPGGFTLALFSPNIAIDALGKVLVLDEKDFDGLTALARQTLALPDTGLYRNTWRIKRDRTEQPIERLFVPHDGGGLRQTCVQGYGKDTRELKVPAGKQLPDVLWELFGLISEAEEGYEGEKEVKDNIIARVKDAMGDI